MKKALVFCDTGFLYPHVSVMAEEVFLLKEAGYEVSFLTCSSAHDSCFCNPEGRECICCFCRRCISDVVARLPQGVKHLSLSRSKSPVARGRRPETIHEIKQEVYRGVFVGYGVLSLYVSQTRDSSFTFDESVREYLGGRLDAARRYVDSVIELLEEQKPDLISIFNGRITSQRPFFDYARTRGIPVRVNEVVPEAPGLSGFRKRVFEDGLPHDIDLNTKSISDVWQQSCEPEDEKLAQGSAFFERRVKGLRANGMDKTFTGRQTTNLLPEGFNPTQCNVAIFNSSEDEFIAVGSEFDRYDLFANQLDGLDYLLSHIDDPEIKFYLRIHPNLTGVDKPLVRELKALPSKYPQLSVIPPESPVSSYALLKAVNKVVTFGSTMGAEAAYWGKPSILLRGSFYMRLGGCYVPKTRDEAVQLVAARTLPALPRDGMIRYGYWLTHLHATGSSLKRFPYRLVSYKPTWLFRKYRTSNNLTIFGSALAARLVSRLLMKFPWTPSRVKCPRKILCTFSAMIKR